MNYESQEEHDHFEGAMQQSLPIQTHNEMPKDTVEEFLQSEPMVRLFAVENNAVATGRLGQYYGKTVREALLDFYTTAYNKGVEDGRVENQNEWYLGKKIQAFGGEYIVVGVSHMIYDEDCEGEPEWKITNEIQEVAIATPFEDHSFQKPSWHKVSALTPLPEVSL
jgi:hypothetical protein